MARVLDKSILSLGSQRASTLLYFPIVDVARENATWLPNFFFGPDGLSFIS